MESPNQQYACSLHPKETAATYCQDHEVFCCLNECLEKHNGHNIIPISKFIALGIAEKNARNKKRTISKRK